MECNTNNGNYNTIKLTKNITKRNSTRRKRKVSIQMHIDKFTNGPSELNHNRSQSKPDNNKYNKSKRNIAKHDGMA